ncbi:hypothetical protein [Spirilliplanes yamanashiensis]|nr:hypothetical protein [Spirilliplanes yamanashiensis]MDP9818454.1 apolipoprotein N-acyltransferase [Spirilliplanes yamanashiensis]
MASDAADAGPEAVLSRRPRPWLAVAFSALAGVAMLAAFPPYGLWWAALLGVALLAVAVHRRRARVGALLGGLAGLGLFVPLLSFTGLQVGWAPWFLLAGLQAGFLAALGAAAAATSALVDRRPWSWPLVAGVLWAGQEALRGRVPFGGFPWGRLAFSQADAPAAGLAALGGAPMVTFAVAVAAGLVAVALWSWCWGWQGVARPVWQRTSAALAGAVTVVVGGLVVPAGAADGRSIVVQTNNATFNTAQAEQQLAMIRLRAVEHGRPAVMASTVGISAVVAPDGALRDATRFNTAAVIVREVRLSARTTVATRLGVLPEVAFAVAALSALVLALVLRTRSSLPRPTPASRGRSSHRIGDASTDAP